MISKLFKKNHPIERGFYVVLKGTYSGQYIAFIKGCKDELAFLSLPDKELLKVPKKDFIDGIQGNIVHFIEVLPKKVFSVVEREYIDINNKNGLRTAKENYKPHKRTTSRTENNNARTK